MTRFLSEALGAQEPYFRQGLVKLEAANNHPNHDIRLSNQIAAETRKKLRDLGLDPFDTSAEELYAVLQQRVREDDQRLIKKLRTIAATKISAEGNVVDGLIESIKQVTDDTNCFAIKNTKFKAILTKIPPKKTMRSLGYRSQTSMHKNEPVASILVAAWLTEGERWQKQLLEQYAKLKASDFEDRQLTILQPRSKHWQQLATDITSRIHHNVISFKELGVLIILPLPPNAPSGSVTTSLALALHAVNDIKASSTFLKLNQVKPDFGQIVKSAAEDEPRLNTNLYNQPMPWTLVQRFCTRFKELINTAVFEPHIEAEDMLWHSIESKISKIEPSFEFWKKTSHLGMIGNDQKPVSMNLIDVALGYTNQLPFGARVLNNFQRAVWQELLLGYLQPELVENAVQSQLSSNAQKELAQL